MQAYRASLDSESTYMVLSPDCVLFSFYTQPRRNGGANSPPPPRVAGIPQPDDPGARR
jgi:hypothetical protein